MNLSGTQLKDTYGNLVTTGTSAGSPTTGGLQNGDGSLLTAVGIGTNSPAEPFDLQMDSISGLKIGTNADGGATLTTYQGSNNSNVRQFQINCQDFEVNTGSPTGTSTSNALFINSSGNVGIGNTNPDHPLTVTANPGSANTPVAWIHNNGNVTSYDGTVISTVNDGSDVEVLHVRTNNTTYSNGTSLMLVRGDGNVGIGTNSPSYPLEVDTGAGTFSVRAKGGSSVTIASDASLTYFGDTHEFSNSAGTTEFMRIDSSGNVLVGTTDDAPGVADTNVGVSLNSGRVFASAEGDYALNLNRNTSDGDISRFRKDGTTVGSIGVISGDVAMYSTTADHNGLRFALDAILPTNNAGLVVDNDANLGSGSYRFKDLHLGGNAYANGFYQNGSVTDNLVISQGTGTSRPSVGLWGIDHASFPGQVHIVSNSSNADADSGEIRFYDYTGSAFQINMTIDKSGNVDVAGALSKGSGSFKIDHPLESKKDTHHLVHSFVESPQANNIYRGSVDLVDGQATVNLDEVSGMTDGTFVLLNTDIHVYTSNESDWDAVKGSVSDNVLTIECQNSSSTAKVNWLVIGERHDQHIIDTNWTDENGKVIVEPLKPIKNELEN